MTFTYAVISRGGIVLVADSQVTFTHKDKRGSIVATYEDTRGKIRRIGNRCAFSTAGNGGFIDTLLAKADLDGIGESLSFDEAVRKYGKVFREHCQAEYPNGRIPLEAAFLFCGYIGDPSKRVPQIVKLDSAFDFQQNPISKRGFAWTGEIMHGAALYLQHRFYREDLELEQAKLLAYCIAAEIADQDNSVGGPIEVEVITPDSSGPLTNLEKYEKARQDLLATVRAYLNRFR